MAQQTAVEWLVRKLSTELIGEIPLHRWDEIREAVQQAKQMEKVQIMDAVERGFNVGCYHPEDRSLKNAEHYYNETYGKSNGEAISKIGNSDLSKTALQRLIEWAESLKHSTQQCTDWICIKDKAEELLQMEREQAFQSFKAGQDSMEEGGKNFEQYYNETFGNK